jgi:hypothetical protein
MSPCRISYLSCKTFSGKLALRSGHKFSIFLWDILTETDSIFRRVNVNYALIVRGQYTIYG